jgi:hypothetical protein
MITHRDIEWLDKKRAEVVRLAEKADQRTWDMPRFLRIIDDLMKAKSVATMTVYEVGRIHESSDTTLPE